MSSILATDLTYLTGVGPKRAKALGDPLAIYCISIPIGMWTALVSIP